MKLRLGKTGWLILLLCFTGILSGGETAAFTPPVIRVGFYPWKGYHQQDRNGVRSGYGYDFLQRLAAHAHIQYEYAGLDQNWVETFDALQQGKIDLMTCVQKTPERLEKVDFSALPMGFSSTVLSVAGDNRKFYWGNYSAWNGIRVGMIEGSIHNTKFDAFARKNGFSYTPVYYTDPVKLKDDLLAHRHIDGALSNNLRDISGERLLLSFDREPFYAVVRKGDRALLERIDRALREIDDIDPGYSNDLWKKYYANNNSAVSFSESETRFLHECKAGNVRFKAVVSPDRPPYFYWSDGKLQGLMGELLTKIIERSGLPIDIVKTESGKDLEAQLEANPQYLRLDALNDPAAAEKERHYLTSPFLTVPISRIYRRGKNTRNTVAVPLGSVIPEPARADFAPDAVLLECDTVDDAVQAVRDGRADVCYLYTGSAEKISREDERGLLISEVLPATPVEIAISIPEEMDPRLWSILTKTILSVSPEEVAELRTRHLTRNQLQFSFLRMFYRNLWTILACTGGILLLVILHLTRILLSQRSAFRHAELLKKLPMRYFVVTLDGKILQYSLGNQLGFKQDGVDFMTLDDLPDPLVNQEMRQAIRKVIESGENTSVSFSYQDAVRRALICKLPDSLFHRPCAVWISQDASELHRSQSELEMQKNLLEEILNNIPAYIVVKDLNQEYRYLFWNHAALEFNGLQLSDVIGKTDAEIPVYKNYVQLFRTEDDAVLRGETFDVVKELRRKDGETRYMRTIITPANILNGHRLELVLGLDVTEMKKFESEREKHIAELKDLAEKAEAADRTKSCFLATMSHEIRTPLNAVIGFSEILKDDTLPPETQKSYLQDISVAGNALLALINDVLDLSKLEANQMLFTPSETDFPELVHEVMTIFQQRFRDKELKNIVRVDAMPHLLLDKLRMRQILFNLVGNAVKFTDRGQIGFSASFTPSNGGSNGTLRFSIADTGCGIPAEDQARLFQPFVQSGAIRGTQAAKNGTSLGLAIIRRMLDQLNGVISLHSEFGKGSTFTVEMREVGCLANAGTAVSPSAPPASSPAPFSGKVLVVDDIAMNLKVTQAMLKKMGIRSEIANGPTEALACLSRTEDITWVICDLWMPEMNGAELAVKIRSLYPDRKWKIFALTADSEDGSHLFDMSGFDAVLHKPINLASLQKLFSGASI